MTVQQAVENESKLLDSFGADVAYNSPSSYSVQNSFYDDGKYPPDWAERRNAIWWLQDDACARCGRDHGGDGHVHHVHHLADGGTNSLDNLVGLCAHCHALLHPTVTDLNGDWRRAAKFPCEDAEPEVAVIRRSRGSAYEEEFSSSVDFAKLATETDPRENVYAAQSPAVYATSADVARQFSHDPSQHNAENRIAALEKLSRLLLLRGRVPENAVYDRRRLDIETSLSGVLGWLSSFEPPIQMTADSASGNSKPYSAVSEDVEPDGSADRRVIFSDDTTAATVTVEGGDRSLIREEISFTDDKRNRSVSIAVSPPPLTTSTAPSYAWVAVKRIVVFLVLVSLVITLLSPFL